MLRQHSCLLILCLVITQSCFASDDNIKTERFAATSPVHALKGEFGSDFSQEPYKSGELDQSKIQDLLTKFGVKSNDTRTTIVHILKWSDTSHTKVGFQKWYVYTPNNLNGSYYLRSKQKMFEDVYIPGEKSFRLLYIHLNADLTSADEFGTYDAGGNAVLKVPVSYSIVVTQQPSQLAQDFKTVLGLLGWGGAADANSRPGYWSISEFDSKFDTSTITVTPSTKTTPVATADAANPNKAVDVKAPAPNTYINEGPTHWGLSFAVPVKSYKDVTYTSSNNTVTPKTITKQSVYLNLDGYWPAAVPGLMAFRYIPHPFVGLPFSGKVFQSPMVGVALGLPWLEIYGGAIFDRENGSVNGQSKKTTTKFSFGVKVSVSAVAKALKGAK